MPSAPATKMMGATPPAELSLELPAMYCRGCRSTKLMRIMSLQTNGLNRLVRRKQAYLNREDVLLTGGVLIRVAKAL